MSRFSERLRAGIDRIRQQAAESVTYSRGALSASLDAVPAMLPAESVDSYGVVIDQSWRDWLIRSQDLILPDDSDATLPEVGDRIEQADGAVWEVLPIEGQRCWRYSDGTNYCLRVHSKLVS